MSYGDRFDQTKISERHGAGAKAQSSDATGTTDDLAGFLDDGTLTNSGLKGSEVLTSSATGRGRWYMQPLTGANGANVDFYTDFIPVSPPTGTPAEVPFQLMQNGRCLNPYRPWYSLAPGSNHVIFEIPPRPTDELHCYYFTGDEGALPSGTPTAATVTMWCSYVDGQGLGTVHGFAAANYSVDDGATFTGSLIGAFSFPSAPFTMQEVTLFADGVRDEFHIADLWLTLTFPGGATLRYKPTAHSVGTATGGSVDPELTYDADSNPPDTDGYVYRAHFSGLSDPSYLLWTDWA
jgi:hypothetical protein